MYEESAEEHRYAGTHLALIYGLRFILGTGLSRTCAWYLISLPDFVYSPLLFSYVAALKKEKAAFEGLIRAKEHLVVSAIDLDQEVSKYGMWLGRDSKLVKPDIAVKSSYFAHRWSRARSWHQRSA